MTSLAPLLLSAMLFAPTIEPATEFAVLEAPSRHIRTTDAGVRKLLRNGFRHSPSFAALVGRLQRSDVFVYVEEVERLPAALEGRLMMLPVAHGFRYVRIQIALRGSPEDSVAVLGHELQHAVEVADAPEVQDQDGIARLYERIGTSSGSHVFDTVAAQEMGRTVRRELRG
jgi:hypothetical protein